MTRPDPARVVALVGNPRAGSRTLGAATALAVTLADRLAGDEPTVVDVAALAPTLHTHPRTPDLDAALAAVAGADLLVVATPVHKASFTGLLKSFLDLYGPDGLDGVTAVPLVVSAAATHALVGEVHLRPVLVELGASVPTRSLAVLDTELGDLAPAVDRWWAHAERPLRRAVGAPADALLEAAR